MSVIEREATESPTVGESGCLVRPVTTVLDPRVERGAALLDEKMPGWAERINLGLFSLDLPERCVLGQVGLCAFNYHDYRDTARRLLGPTANFGSAIEQEHGFFGREFTDDPDGDRSTRDWALLEQDWRLAILSRRLPA